MARMTFERVKLTATRRIKAADGRSRTQQRTFEQTINPFNKRADGQIKSRSDIHDELHAEAQAWKRGE